jgi:hypothetical protein
MPKPHTCLLSEPCKYIRNSSHRTFNMFSTPGLQYFLNVDHKSWGSMVHMFSDLQQQQNVNSSNCLCHDFSCFCIATGLGFAEGLPANHSYLQFAHFMQTIWKVSTIQWTWYQRIPLQKCYLCESPDSGIKEECVNMLRRTNKWWSPLTLAACTSFLRFSQISKKAYTIIVEWKICVW